MFRKDFDALRRGEEYSLDFEKFVEKVRQEADAEDAFNQARLDLVVAEKEVIGDLQHALVLAHNRLHGTAIKNGMGIGEKLFEFIGFREDTHQGWQAVYRIVDEDIALDFEIRIQRLLDEQVRLEQKSETSLLPIAIIAAAVGAAGLYGAKLKRAKQTKGQNVRVV